MRCHDRKIPVLKHDISFLHSDLSASVWNRAHGRQQSKNLSTRTSIHPWVCFLALYFSDAFPKPGAVCSTIVDYKYTKCMSDLHLLDYCVFKKSGFTLSFFLCENLHFFQVYFYLKTIVSALFTKWNIFLSWK